VQPQEVLNYWFAEIKETAEYLEARNQIWWRKSPEVDKDIRNRFEQKLKALANGEYRDWVKTAEGWCAAIVVLDQMSRNMYRGRPESFAYDSLALTISREGITRKLDEKLHVLHRVFCYLPFEHSESLEDQNESVAYFERLIPLAPAVFKAQIEENHDYAIKHLKVIERFGRFPHRNVILGRKSTAEETEFLKGPGSSF